MQKYTMKSVFTHKTKNVVLMRCTQQSDTTNTRLTRQANPYNQKVFALIRKMKVVVDKANDVCNDYQNNAICSMNQQECSDAWQEFDTLVQQYVALTQGNRKNKNTKTDNDGWDVIN